MEIELKENEEIEDLQFKNLKIIQNKQGFCFGIDAVLLSDYAKDIKKDSKVIDLGTGTGIIATLLCGKTNLKKIIGVEIQKEVADMAKRSIELNNLQDKFEIINEDLNNLDKILEIGTFDAIVTNPPYKKLNSGIENISEEKLISRHEIKCSLEEVIKTSAKLLKNCGSLYMVHRPDRMADIIYNLRLNKLEPKKVRFVYANLGKEPKMVLIKAVKNGNPFLKIETPLFVYNEDGGYTEEILKIYGKNQE